MQTTTITRVMGGIGAAALVALGMTLSVPHMAAQDPGQQPPPMGRMGGRGFGGPGMGRGGPGGPMGMGIDPRDLTDTQRDQVKAIRDAHATDVRAAMDRVQKAHEALATAVMTGSGDIKSLAIEVGNAEGEAAFQNAQVESEIFNTVLTADQKQKIQDRRKEMEARRATMQQRRQGGAGNGK